MSEHSSQSHPIEIFKVTLSHHYTFAFPTYFTLLSLSSHASLSLMLSCPSPTIYYFTFLHSLLPSCLPISLLALYPSPRPDAYNFTFFHILSLRPHPSTIHSFTFFMSPFLSFKHLTGPTTSPDLTIAPDFNTPCRLAPPLAGIAQQIHQFAIIRCCFLVPPLILTHYSQSFI